LIDTNGNGRIEKKEFALFYEQMKKINFTGDMYDVITAAVDKNGDNKIQ